MPYLTKVEYSEDDGLVVKVPEEVAEKFDLKRGSFVNVTVELPKEYVVEVDKPVLEELKRMKEKWPAYKDLELNEILKDIMIKFNAKEEEVKQIPNTPLKIVEKGKL